MNPELHHRWNSERDPQRGSNLPVGKNPQANVPENKVLLKQNKPR
jgi:hypothetical protein